MLLKVQSHWLGLKQQYLLAVHLVRTSLYTSQMSRIPTPPKKVSALILRKSSISTV